MQSWKTPPSVSTTPHQAFGIPAVYGPQREKKRDPEPSGSTNHCDKYGGSLQVLELAQSPVHKKGAYFQFYYTDRRESASSASGEKRKKKRFLPAQLHKISNQLSQDKKSSQEIVAVRPSAKTQRKSIASIDDQGSSSSSHQHLQTIPIRKFESSNRATPYQGQWTINYRGHIGNDLKELSQALLPCNVCHFSTRVLSGLASQAMLFVACQSKLSYEAP